MEKHCKKKVLDSLFAVILILPIIVIFFHNFTENIFGWLFLIWFICQSIFYFWMVSGTKDYWKRMGFIFIPLYLYIFYFRFYRPKLINVSVQKKDNREKCKFCEYKTDKEYIKKHEEICDENPKNKKKFFRKILKK